MESTFNVILFHLDFFFSFKCSLLNDKVAVAGTGRLWESMWGCGGPAHLSWGTEPEVRSEELRGPLQQNKLGLTWVPESPGTWKIEKYFVCRGKMKLMLMHHQMKLAFLDDLAGFCLCMCVRGVAGGWGGPQISTPLCLCRQPPVLN